MERDRHVAFSELSEDVDDITWNAVLASNRAHDEMIKAEERLLVAERSFEILSTIAGTAIDALTPDEFHPHFVRRGTGVTPDKRSR